MPVSIQLEPPEGMRWNHRNSPHQITLCMLPGFQCAASTHRPPVVPEPHLRVAPLGRKSFPRTTPGAVKQCQQRNGSLFFDPLGEQAYQCNVNLPGLSNMLLTWIEEVDKLLSTIFWQRLDEAKTKAVDRGQVLICLRTFPDFLDCHNCVLGRVSCLLPLCYPCLETRCHHVNWCAEVL